MNSIADKSTELSPGRNALTPGKAVSILWDCVWEALILAFLVQLFGGIAVGMTGNIWSRMTPSLPPGLANESSETGATPLALSLAAQQRFGLIFAVLFVAMAAGRLMRYSRHPERRKATAWLTRVSRRVSEEWLSLVVVNAFIASVMVSVLQISSQFTFTKMLWQLLAGLIQPVTQALASLLPEGLVGVITGLVDWFNANQFKFSFWLLYSAAICDDLGLPNYKAFGRFLWRRKRRRRKPAVAEAPPD